MNLMIGIGLGVAIGVFHIQLWTLLKPLLVKGWDRFKAWRASRVV